jgi:hypothetical protein
MDKKSTVAQIIEKLKEKFFYSQGQLDDIQFDLQEWSQVDLDNYLSKLNRPAT